LKRHTILKNNNAVQQDDIAELKHNIKSLEYEINILKSTNSIQITKNKQ